MTVPGRSVTAGSSTVATGLGAGPKVLATFLIPGVMFLLPGTRKSQIARFILLGIVVGYAGAAIRRHLGGRRVTFFENPEWDGPNGLSVLSARSFVTERTLLVMADQIAAPALVHELAALPAGAGPTVLAVDRDLARVFDIDDATKVALGGEKVSAIGKGLTRYDAISAGLFVMAPSLIAALDRMPRPSLTEMPLLASTTQTRLPLFMAATPRGAVPPVRLVCVTKAPEAW